MANKWRHARLTHQQELWLDDRHSRHRAPAVYRDGDRLHSSPEGE
jgi:hypothetical protein